MSASAAISPGTHAAQFHKGEYTSSHAIATFLSRDAGSDDSLVIVARRHTLRDVVQRLSSGLYGPPEMAENILPVEAEAALEQITDQSGLVPAFAGSLFADLLSQARARHPKGTIRLYGEIVDVLCQRGRFQTALELEDLAPGLFSLDPRLVILCGYSIAHFANDTSADWIRAVCQKHNHIFPTASI